MSIFWRLWRGGAPVNKYCELGSLSSTETNYCRLSLLASADALLSFPSERTLTLLPEANPFEARVCPCRIVAPARRAPELWECRLTQIFRKPTSDNPNSLCLFIARSRRMAEVDTLLSFVDFPVATDESLRGQLKSLRLKGFLLDRENPPAQYGR